jgi:hypothetical protein
MDIFFTIKESETMSATDFMIFVSKEARDELRIFKATLGITYDEAIKELLRVYKRDEKITHTTHQK